MTEPVVGVVMGSDSDWETMQHAARRLEELGVPFEARVVSAHRTPDLLFRYAEEAAGRGLNSGANGATLERGRPGILHGCRTMLLQDADGQVVDSHSIAAGLDYPGVGPEHAHLQATGRAEYAGISDQEALAAFHALARAEGILPALESAHAVAYAMQMAARPGPDTILLVNLSGRGDKDLAQVMSTSDPGS